DGVPAALSGLDTPSDIKLDAAGNLYIAVAGSGDVRVINMQSSAIVAFGVSIPAGAIRTVAGIHTRGYSGDGGPALAAQLNAPAGIALDAAGNMYIADAGNHAIRRINSAGTITTVSGLGPSKGGYSGDGGAATGAALSAPGSVAADAAGNLLIADTGNGSIRLVNNQTVPITAFGITLGPGDI